MEKKLIDIVVNGQLVGVLLEDLAKMFLTTLINQLPAEMSIATYIHQETEEEVTLPTPAPEAVTEPKPVAEKKSK